MRNSPFLAVGRPMGSSTSGSSYRNGRAAATAWQTQENYLPDAWRDYDNEDIDHAIAPSLSEEDQKGKKVIGRPMGSSRSGSSYCNDEDCFVDDNLAAGRPMGSFRSGSSYRNDEGAAASAQQTQFRNDRVTSPVLSKSTIVYGREEEKARILKQVLYSPEPAAPGNEPEVVAPGNKPEVIVIVGDDCQSDANVYHLSVKIELSIKARTKNSASDPESGNDENSLLRKKAMPTHTALDPESGNDANSLLRKKAMPMHTALDPESGNDANSLLRKKAMPTHTALDPESGNDANSLLRKKVMPTHTAFDPESGNDADSLLRKKAMPTRNAFIRTCLALKTLFFHESLVNGGSREIELLTTESIQYDLIILKEATNDFSVKNLIGRGGFGVVYKGVLANGEEIAVKRLTTHLEHNTEEFKNEVSLVARLQHRNLVRLMGFCFDGEEKLLVFEFAPNGSLDRFLFGDQEKRKQLDWRRRYKIIEQIARGLLYLHEDSRHRIVHRDLKPANILLDTNMIPKISDFGLARLVHIDNSCIETSQIAGTFGYMAPEYVLHALYSVKSDVYSFGVLILEIISGSRRVRSSDQSGMFQDLLNDAWNCWSDGEALKFMDETLASSYYSSIEVKKCIHLGLLCVQRNPDKRPTMTFVVNTLNNITTIILPEPQRPLFLEPLVAESRKIGIQALAESSSKSSAKWTKTHSSKVTNP